MFSKSMTGKVSQETRRSAEPPSQKQRSNPHSGAKHLVGPSNSYRSRVKHQRSDKFLGRTFMILLSVLSCCTPAESKKKCYVVSSETINVYKRMDGGKLVGQVRFGDILVVKRNQGIKVQIISPTEGWVALLEDGVQTAHAPEESVYQVSPEAVLYEYHQTTTNEKNTIKVSKAAPATATYFLGEEDEEEVYDENGEIETVDVVYVNGDEYCYLLDDVEKV